MMCDQSLAFAFPLQGSRNVGILASARERCEAVGATFSEVSDALGYNIWNLIRNGEHEALNLTEATQPVLLTSSVALCRAWLAAGGARPSVSAGHSLGEFSALGDPGALPSNLEALQ
jgi:[acyl-carrier-protein] S-malonyltransferase